jgi:acyl-CoA thioesterase-1
MDRISTSMASLRRIATAVCIIQCCLVSLAAASAATRLVFVGDSLTAGYQLDPSQAYPALIGEQLRASGSNVDIVNAGLSGDTSAGGLRRIDWLLRRPADIFVIALGANDALRGQDPAATAANLSSIIGKIRSAQPEAAILLAGMYAPPNMGKAYTEQFNALYPQVAADHKVPLMPFLLDGVAGQSQLNLSDGIHPNPRGHQIIAANLLKHLQPLLPGT